MPKMNEEQIIRTEYSEIMQKSYIDYAMSVIIARALPDVRDGLKPVQRRTLYDMHQLGIRFDRPYRKCARIVGDTMGKYHPHGDTSIYDALVVMAQDFKKGLPLVDGHGNFGSIEGDGAAAMRYTEARLSRVTQEAFLSDMDKDVVSFGPNFDETEQEPEVLPVRLPNLLVNGSDGIAVGMVTSIPPHNLGEVIDAVKAYMANEDISTEELLEIMPGPDFPTGGIVINKDELKDIYTTGQGKIKLRGRVSVENVKGGKQRIVITEIPYTMIGANIGKFLNDVYALVESKKTSDIVDISNQSSKEGIRIVIELRKGADTEQLINLLYKKTRLEDTFGVNMLAVADGRPETLGLKQIIEYFLDFQFEINTRKYRNMLSKELEKKEIQEGLIAACDCIDLIIEILRGSKNINQAKACLTKGDTTGIKFKTKRSEADAKKLHFTENQAKAILEMRLYKLIGLEIEALEKEHAQTLKNIASYEDILENHSSMQRVIRKELDQIKKAYARPRRTTIENGKEAVLIEKPAEAMEVVYLMDRFGYCKCMDTAAYERSKEAVDSEYRYIIRLMNTDRICLFTDTGSMHQVRLGDVPMGRLKDKGVPVDNLCNYDSSHERILYVESLSYLITARLLFISSGSYAKQVSGTEFDVSKRTIAATKLGDGDTLCAVIDMDKTNAKQLVLQTKAGIFIRFASDEIPEKKKNAVGVRCIQLGAKDMLEAVWPISNPGEDMLSWQDKTIPAVRIKLSRRDTKGTKLRIS